MKTDDKGRTYYVNTETRKSQWTVPEELKSNVSGSEAVVGENATDKEGGVENVKSDVLKVASYSYDKSLVLKGGHLQRLTSNGIWRTEFVNLTEDLFVLSQSGEWEDRNLLQEVGSMLPLLSCNSTKRQRTVLTAAVFIIYFNPGTCEGLEDGINEVRVKCRNDIESMEW